MRTLKICVVAVLLLLSAMPAAAMNYPPKIKTWIEQSQDQFVCELPSSLFVHFHLKPGGTIAIIRYAKEEKLISRVDVNGGINNIINIKLKNGWRATNNLTTKTEEEKKKNQIASSLFWDVDWPTIVVCIDSNLRTRGLL